MQHDLDAGVGEHLGERRRVEALERVEHRDLAADADLHEAQQRPVAPLGHELRVDPEAPLAGGALGQARDVAHAPGCGNWERIDGVPPAVGEQRALAHQQLRRGRDRVAGARPARAQRLLDHLRDRLRRPAEAADRAALLVHALGRARDVRVELRVVALARARLGHAARRGLAERRPDQPRLDQDHVDAEGLDLEAQRVGDRLDRVLGRVVEAAAREDELPAHRGQVDDLAPALPAHPGQHELAQAHEAEHVGLELVAHLVHRDRLDRAGLAVAGVVDEHADRAVLALRPPRPRRASTSHR